MLKKIGLLMLVLCLWSTNSMAEDWNISFGSDGKPVITPGNGSSSSSGNKVTEENEEDDNPSGPVKKYTVSGASNVSTDTNDNTISVTFE